MKFSLHVQTRISDWHFIKDLENLGYDAAWVPDTQMMWSDCYSTMALAAKHLEDKNWHRCRNCRHESRH